MASCVALLLVLCFVESSLASQQVKAMRVLRAQLSGNEWPNLASQKPMRYFYYIGSKPSYYEAFPFLQDLKRVVQNNGTLIDYVPYGNYPLNPGGYQKYPFFYRQYGDINAGTVPDDWTQDDINNINAEYQSFSDDQKNALPGTFVAGNQTSGETTTKFLSFNKSTPGTLAYSGGVYTYDDKGEVVVSFPDNTGYISGYKPLPDGTYTPTYYIVENNQVTEVSSVPLTDYDSLTVDEETGNYSLNIPNYTRQLDLIVNKLDGITLTAPVVNVNPEVNVSVSGTGTDLSSVESTLDDVSDSLTDIGSLLQDSLVVDPVSTPSITNEVGITTEEQAIIDQYRAWETNIPLIGSTLDTGLTALLGRIPDIGQEYVWIDYTPGSRSRSSSPLSILSGMRIHVDLTEYRDIILAFRGWIILAECLWFILATWKIIREATKA